MTCSLRRKFSLALVVQPCRSAAFSSSGPGFTPPIPFIVSLPALPSLPTLLPTLPVVLMFGIGAHTVFQPSCFGIVLSDRRPKQRCWSDNVITRLERPFFDNTQVVARIRNKQNLFKSKARKMGRNFVWKARYARPLGTCARRLIVQGKQGEKNGRYSPRATVPE
ncbi:hypothetical protein V8E53_000844 [Lactarius tabidus]